jgi:predicted ATPase
VAPSEDHDREGKQLTHILSFSIDGLAGRRKSVSRDLEPDVNVFWGDNGSGKTSLLKILHSALANDATSLARVPFGSATVELETPHKEHVVRTFTKGESEGHFETVFDADDGEVTELWVEHDPAWRTTPQTREGQRYAHGYLPISRVSEGGADRLSRRPASLQAAARRQLWTEAAYDREFANAIEERWRTYATSALVRIRNVQEIGLAQILSLVIQGPSHNNRIQMAQTPAAEAFDLVSNFFEQQPRLRLKIGNAKTFSRRYEEDPLLRAIVGNIEGVLDEVHTAQLPQLRLEKLIHEMFSGAKHLEFSAEGIKVTSGDSEIPLQSLSSGERQLLLLLLECLRLDGNTVIIDEPELSMHVEWQRRLVSTLMTVSPGVQLIMATHSPEVMAMLPDRSVSEL